MQLVANSQVNLIAHEASLDFTPVAALPMDLELPYFKGTRVVHLDFSAGSTTDTNLDQEVQQAT